MTLILFEMRLSPILGGIDRNRCPMKICYFFLVAVAYVRMYFESKNIAFNFHRWLDFRSSDPDADDVGHKWSLSALLKHLKSENHDTGLLMRRIEEMIVKAILATAPPIVTACRLFVPYVENCFGDFFLSSYYFSSLLSHFHVLCVQLM